MPTLDERLFEATIGTLELFGVYLGTRLGLYEALHSRGPATAPELAKACGVDERYAREWLEQQAVAGLLTAEDPSAAADERVYTLPAEHAGVLVDGDDPAHVAPFADMIIGIAAALDDVVDAYRTGRGVPYARYGRAFRHGQGAINRPAFRSDLVSTWLPAAGLDERLRASDARLADVGCGHGWSTTAISLAYPQADIIGLDSDRASIEEAAAHAAEQGANARFVKADAGSIEAHGPFDVILFMEVLHDLARPVEALSAARQALRASGVVLVADEQVAARFQAPGDELERMMYGWSINHCLPASRAEADSAALGTVLREDTVRTLATDAGFGRVEVVDVDAGFFRLYKLVP